jgi:glycosyltransferase involved in cell wall biosynthesis
MTLAPIRVLHVLGDLAPGGAERLVLELCVRGGESVRAEVATVHDGGALAPAYAAAGIRVHPLCRVRGRPGLRSVLALARLARQFDVVHTHLWAGDVWGRLGAELGRARAIFSTEHNVDADESWARRRVKSATVAFVDRFVAVSEAVARHVEIAYAVPGSRIDVVPNGVDASRFAAPHEGGGGVLAIGRLVPQKGFHVLVEAARRLEVPVAIAGEGPLRETLERAAAGRVQFLGAVSDVAPLLAHADVLVVPSLWEGFGLVALEGLAAGVPVVASDTGGLREVVGTAGMLVPPGDPSALADVVRTLMRDGSWRGDLSRRGRDRARAFGIDATVRRLEASYRRVLERPVDAAVRGP